LVAHLLDLRCLFLKSCFKPRNRGFLPLIYFGLFLHLSLHGDLDLALSQTEFQITMIRNIVWRGLVPVWVAASLWMVILFHLKGASAWMYALVAAIAIASLVIVILRKQRLIRERYLPRRQELRSLRAKLVDIQH
jgi:hypothetical protein